MIINFHFQLVLIMALFKTKLHFTDFHWQSHHRALYGSGRCRAVLLLHRVRHSHDHAQGVGGGIHPRRHQPVPGYHQPLPAHSPYPQREQEELETRFKHVLKGLCFIGVQRQWNGFILL